MDVINQILLDSKRVVLSVELVWNRRNVLEIEPVENKGCKQEVNYTLECGHVWPSWIFNDCIVCGPRA